MSRARVLLADDHRLVAEGLKKILTAEFDLVGVVEDGRALIAATKTLRPDVIVSDITMPNLNGIEALEELKKIDPGVRMIFLTMHRDVVYARRALEAGAYGFVLKQSAPEELIMAVRAALERPHIHHTDTGRRSAGRDAAGPGAGRRTRPHR